MDNSTLEQRIERMKKRNEFFYDEDIALCIRSLEAWQKVKEELKEEMTGLDMFVEKEHTIRWCLHVIDEALGEVGEQDG